MISFESPGRPRLFGRATTSGLSINHRGFAALLWGMCGALLRVHDMLS